VEANASSSIAGAERPAEARTQHAESRSKHEDHDDRIAPRPNQDGFSAPSARAFREVFSSGLEDPFLDLIDHRSPLSDAAALDVLSGMVPVLFLAFALIAGDLRIWTKCCLCGSLLALLKAFLARATVVPDSAGWEGCKERLGPAGLRYFRAEDRLSFKSEFLFGVVDVLRLDVLGVWLEGSEGRHPFCADMMFSGHAYFCAIFSLGLYDLARKHTALLGLLARASCRFFVGVTLLALLCFDMESIMANRVHYTVDIVIALVLSLLLFSNPAVAAVTEYWAVGLSGGQGVLEFVCPGGNGAHCEKDVGDLLVPPCCFPLCCFPGRYHLSALPDRQQVFEREMGQLHDSYGAQLRDLRKQLSEVREELRSSEEERRKTEAQLLLSVKQAQEAERARIEQHTKEMDAVQRSLALEKSKSQELEQSLSEHRTRLQEQEEKHQEERRALRVQLEEETISRKRFEERSQTLAQVLVTRENERQEAAALLLGARGARSGGDALEQAAAALVAGVGFESPLAKLAADSHVTEGKDSPAKALAEADPVAGEAAPKEAPEAAADEEPPPEKPAEQEVAGSTSAVLEDVLVNSHAACVAPECPVVPEPPVLEDLPLESSPASSDGEAAAPPGSLPAQVDPKPGTVEDSTSAAAAGEAVAAVATETVASPIR